MTAPVPDVSPLGVLGFSAREEGIYRVALRSSGGTLAELAALVRLPLGELREHLARFAGAGLVELHDDVVLARPPQEALARLVSEESRRVQHRHDQLEGVRGLLPSLSADYLASAAPQGEPVTLEVVDGGDVAALVRSLSAASSGDLLWLRPDPHLVPSSREIDDWVVDLIRSGRRSRAIYSARSLEHSAHSIRRRALAGEQVRLLPEIPTRLAVLGSSSAMVAERFGVYDDRRLVLRQPSLVASLTLMFEGLWDTSFPVPGLEGARDADPDGDRRTLLSQLAAGAKDEQIARSLAISVRTVRRRVADLLEELGAGSRFEAGAEAVRRKWL